MGIEAGEFVHPERVSAELYCPICACVLENPVQTPTEHLFCEDELLEWMIQSDACPVTKNKLNPDDIRKPGRIITNLLGELERCVRTPPCLSSSNTPAPNFHPTLTNRSLISVVQSSWAPNPNPNTYILIHALCQ